MTERHFRVVELEGKKVEIGGVSISSKASPGNAARKLLTSIAHHKGLKKNKKPSMGKVKFCIQEYTQGSSKKVYGPYVGHFHKYTGAELKKAMTAEGKVKFTMKPVVKLAKRNMKGGYGYMNRYKIVLEKTLGLINNTGHSTYELGDPKYEENKHSINDDGVHYIVVGHSGSGENKVPIVLNSNIAKDLLKQNNSYFLQIFTRAATLTSNSCLSTTPIYFFGGYYWNKYCYHEDRAKKFPGLIKTLKYDDIAKTPSFAYNKGTILILDKKTNKYYIKKIFYGTQE